MAKAFIFKYYNYDSSLLLNFRMPLTFVWRRYEVATQYFSVETRLDE